jgi:methylenetetrahydrofolate reductase (NADPH)
MKGYCDAINVTDNVRGIPSMSSIVSSYLILKNGIEPILHLTTRDRNKIALQSDLYGAYALGIRNILFITGDHVLLGSHHQAETVYEIDSIQALDLAHDLMSGYDSAGNELEGIPQFYLGSSFNHNAESMEEEASRVEQKVEAGAQFFQSQAIFDVDCFVDFLKHIKNLPIKIMAGVIPLRNLETAEFMHYLIPGIEIPDEIFKEFQQVGAGKTEKEADDAYQKTGLSTSLEIIGKLQEINRIDGLHIMAVGWEESLASLVTQSGLYPRSKMR